MELNEKHHCVNTYWQTHPAPHRTVMWACVIPAAVYGLCSVHARGRARAHSHVIVSEIRLDSASASGRTRVLTCRELPSAIWPWQPLTVSYRERLMFITYLPVITSVSPLSNLCARRLGAGRRTPHQQHVRTSTLTILFSFLMLF